MKRLYPQRRLLRWLEKLWTRVEGFPNRLTDPAFNPLYHLGTLAIFLLVVLAVTGTYLTIFYRPGAERAYETVAGISASWLGSLMRSVHRYASDGLILVILLHALKTLLSDRFWGSRWLAWVSGWALLVLIWIIGVMGYWLVWDQQAQWLTEYLIDLLGGAVASAFLSPEIASRTFFFFVIVLFLHIFLGVLLLLGVLVHVLRLSRARYWSPRWLMVQAGAVLVLLALWRPVSSAAPADLSRLVNTVNLDWWYLGFLPLAARWGDSVFWGVAGLLLILLVVLPWLARGRHLGPAVVTEAMCTGCALCFQQCPYGAIEMRRRTDGSRFDYQAVISPTLCTGCGLCVGVCSTAGVELVGLPTRQIRERLQELLAGARSAGNAPVVVFTCQRHLALGTLPATAPEPQPGAVALRPALALASLGGGNPHPKSASLVTCPLPCVGMVQPEWVRDSLAKGAEAAVILSCPADDCAFREGPHWLAERLGRQQSLLRRGVYWLEAAPGDRGAVTALLQEIQGNREKGEKEKGKKGKWPAGLGFSGVTPRLSFRSIAAGLVILILTFGLSVAAQRPAAAVSGEQGAVRVLLIHSGKLKHESGALSPEIAAKLPPGVSVQQVVGGERFPVHLRLQVDEGPVIERVYRPGGLRREGQVYGLESLALPPGNHQLRLWVMDDGANWRPVFAGPVDVEPGRVRILQYDEDLATFVLR
jgi:ferredoxin